jgi:hypothetical protein
MAALHITREIVSGADGRVIEVVVVQAANDSGAPPGNVVTGRFAGRWKVRDASPDRELEELRRRLAENRKAWVPIVAPNAAWDKTRNGWTIGDITGKAGNSLLINADPERGHIDFNSMQWTGDDLKLIGALKGVTDFPELKRYAAKLIDFPLNGSAGGGGQQKGDERKGWPVIMPVPAGVVAAPDPRPKAGEKLEGRHTYRDRDGRVLMLSDRFRDVETGKKRFQPWTWRHPPGDPSRGQWVGYVPVDQLPLYGLDRLPGAQHALLVEGVSTPDQRCIGCGVRPWGRTGSGRWF